MAKQTPLIRSFNAGEWSPLMAGRVDLDKYSASCRRMYNFLPTPQGAAVARNGTAYVVGAANNGSTSALLPFQFSTVQACVLEFGDKILRFITEGGLVTTGDGVTPYTVAAPYAAADTASIRYAQKNDLLYLFCAGYPVYKLSRFSSTNWTLEQVAFKDGPYLDVNYDANRATPLSIGGSGFESFTWTAEAGDNQKGSATWNFSSSKVLTGYQLFIAENDSETVNSTIYSAKDRAPSTWKLYGSNNQTTWMLLDSQTTYVNWSSNCTDWFTLNNDQSFQYYKIDVTQTYINQSVSPSMSNVVMTTTSDVDFEIQFDSTTNINFGNGFTADDIGRDMRLQRSDGVWVPFQITTVHSTTLIACRCLGAPLANTSPTTYWRLGLYGDANGYPSCGCFFSERLWMGGVTNYPDTLCGSQVGSYETMQPDDPRTGAVSDSDAINITLESRSQLLWMTADDRGLVMGTAAGEWTVQPGNGASSSGSPITPTSIVARSPTQRGSADVDAVRIDHQILYIQRSGRQVRALSYHFEIDGYQSASVSTQATHLGQPAITRLAYQAEPYSTVWAIRSDGILLSLTYMPDEQVQGWAQHDVDGVVESIAVIPAPDSQQDTLWLVVQRTVNGQTVRYIERMLRQWDFDMTEADAAYVDCCTVDTSKAQVVSVPHLAAETVYGLIDGKTVVGPLAAGADGSIDLGQAPTQQVIVGLPMTAELITQRLEAGAQLGTAQGKIKRIDQIVFRFWATGAGAVSRAASLNYPQPDEYPIQLTPDYGVLDPDEVLHSFDYPFIMEPGYDRDGSVRIVRRAQDLLPLNIVSMTVWVDTQDGA